MRSVAAFVAVFALVTTTSFAQEAASETYALESSTMSMLAVSAGSERYSMTATMGQPVAGGSLSSALFTLEVGYVTSLDADADGVSGAFDLCPSQYAGCNDTNGDGCIDVPDPDVDGDGVGRGACDCDDTNGQIWGRPGEVRNVRFASSTTVVWDPPAAAGGAHPRYDVIRASNASDFETNALCIESDDAVNTSADDSGNPTAGAVFYYLVRAENGCAVGIGPLGVSRGLYARSARTCQ